MNTEALAQALEAIEATARQYRNGYHLSEQDIKDFNAAMGYINKLALMIRRSI